MYSCPEVKTNFVRKRFKRPMKAKNQNKTKIPQMYRLTFHQTLLRYSDREIEFSVLYSYFSKTTKFTICSPGKIYMCLYTPKCTRNHVGLAVNIHERKLR